MKILLVLLILFFSIAGVCAETCNCTIMNVPICGDVNGDGLVDSDDISALRGYVNQGTPLNCSIPYCEPCNYECEECEGNGTAIVETVYETVYVSPDYEDVALLFYIFIIPILYLFIAFKKGMSTKSLSAIFLVFAFFFVLFQIITIPVNYIYLIIFLFLFITSIAGITSKQGAD